MKPINFLIALLLSVLLLWGSACHKHRWNDNSLPPATQEGKNTLGFLLNGKPWTPKGFRGEASNLSLDFDPDYKQGIFSIVAYDFTQAKAQQFIIGVRDSLNFLSIPITLKLGKNTLYSISFKMDSCDYFNQLDEVQSSGSLTLTKLDVTTNRVIISGKFNATLYRPGCDTIHITEGRFDMSLH